MKMYLIVILAICLPRCLARPLPQNFDFWKVDEWGPPSEAPADLSPDDCAQRGRISFEVIKHLIRSQVKDGLPNHSRSLRVYGDGPFRPLQGALRREEVLLAQRRGSCSLLLGETRKRVHGADSTYPRCGEEEEDLEHILRACPELESPRRRNFVQVPRRSWLCRRIRWRWLGSSGRSSNGPRDRSPLNNNNNNLLVGLRQGKMVLQFYGSVVFMDLLRIL
jgi:hypothetical protein